VGQMRWQFELFFRYFHPMCRTPARKAGPSRKKYDGRANLGAPVIISNFSLSNPTPSSPDPAGNRRVPQPQGCQLRYRTRNGRRYQRRRHLPGAGWVIVGLDYLNVHQWYLPHARHVVVVEVALLHHAVRRS